MFFLSSGGRGLEESRQRPAGDCLLQLNGGKADSFGTVAHNDPNVVEFPS